MPRLRIVTTSWDDGDPQDLRVAELLDSRGLKGTFYVPIIGYDGRRILEPAELRSLASGGFEIGAHGVSFEFARAGWKKSSANQYKCFATRKANMTPGLCSK